MKGFNGEEKIGIDFMSGEILVIVHIAVSNGLKISQLFETSTSEISAQTLPRKS